MCDVYEVHGRVCTCTGEKLLLRIMTDKEAKVYLEERGIPKGAVFACRHGCRIIANWRLIGQSVKQARWALKERYHLTPYDGEWLETNE